MSDARKFFADNLQRLGRSTKAQATRDPEKYNLYSGLFQMACQVLDMQRPISSLQEHVQMLQRSMRQ
jgi:hypothetical protein